MASKPETLFRQKVLKYLNTKKEHIMFFTIQQSSIRGTPDILACVRGYFFGIELKSKEGKPSKLQEYNLNRIAETGGYAILLYPENFNKFKDSVEEFIDTHGGLFSA